MSSNDRYAYQSGPFSRVDTSKPCIGVVKENRDDQLMGRLKVWIKGSTSGEEDPNGWIWVGYCSPFGGATETSTLGYNYQQYQDTQKSYGFWAVPPDVGNEVIVLFVNGDIGRGYWIGGMFHKNMNRMVPGIGEGRTYQATDERFKKLSNPSIPASEYNKLSGNTSQSPYFEPLALGLLKQGLIQDDLRGAGASSARRESPSKVTGLLTPGGNQLVMDDGEGSELIRLRTKSGAQLLISETYGHIYVISRDGNNWIEMNNEGHIDVYAAGDVSIRSQGNMNLYADKNINMEAGQGINMKANGEAGIAVNAAAGPMAVLVNKELELTSEESWSLYSKGSFGVMGAEAGIFSQGDGESSLGEIPSKQEIDRAPELQDNDTTYVEVNTKTIVSRLPHHEPWPAHAVLPLAERAKVEEGDSANASVGSVTQKAKAPLPLVGTPKAGMRPGIYTPVGYDGDSPRYEYSGPTDDLKPVNELKTSQAGVAFIAGFEGFSANKYFDYAGYSIGYGHLIKPGENFDGGISQADALILLDKDLAIFESAIRKGVKVPLTQNQFDALVSFAFNIGTGGFSGSTLLKKLNAGSYQEVPNEMMKWNKVTKKGVKVEHPGLTKRRRAEGLVFATSATRSTSI